MEQINEHEEAEVANRPSFSVLASSRLPSTGSRNEAASLTSSLNSTKRRKSSVIPTQVADEILRTGSDVAPEVLREVAQATRNAAASVVENRQLPGLDSTKKIEALGGGSSDWDHLYWAAMAGTSPTLQLCRDIDGHVIVLLEDLAELAAWKRDVFEQRLLPLPQFTRLSTTCSKLTRSKAMLTNSVSFLNAQVRALLVEAKNEEALQLQRELQLRRNDPSMHLEEEIEQLSSELENVQIEAHETKCLRNWERFISTIEFKIFEENFRNKLQKSLTKYIKHVKDKNTIGSLWISDEKGGGGLAGEGEAPTAPAAGVTKGKKGGSKVKASVRQQAILKREAEKIEKQQATLKRREEKLSYQQERFREAFKEFEANKREMERKVQEEREFVRNSRLAQDKMAIILDQRKKDLETEKEKINVNFHKRAEELAERENEIDARFPELSKVEGQIAEQLRNLHRTAQHNLRGMKDAKASEEAAKIASEALKFAHEHAKDLKVLHDSLPTDAHSRASSREGPHNRGGKHHHHHHHHKVSTVDAAVQCEPSRTPELPPIPALVTDVPAQDDTSSINSPSPSSPNITSPTVATAESEEKLPETDLVEEGKAHGAEEPDRQQEEAAKEEAVKPAEVAAEEPAAVEEREEEGQQQEEAANKTEENPPATQEAVKEAEAEQAEAAEMAAEEVQVESQPASQAVAAVELPTVLPTVEGQRIERGYTPDVVLNARLQSPQVVQVDTEILEMKDKEIAELQDKCLQLELKVTELDLFSAEEQERIKAKQAHQQIELDLAWQRLEAEKRLFSEHVKSFTRSEEDKNLLLKKLDHESRALQASELAAQQEALNARRTALEKQEESMSKSRAELVEREETVRELALKVEHALEQADAEQKDFEDSMLEQTRVFREKEFELEKKLKWMRIEEGKEINVERRKFQQQVEAKEAELATKQGNLEKLEATLAREVEKLQRNAEQEVGKLLLKERSEVEKREAVVEARMHDLDLQFAKVQEAGQARKLLAEAEARMAKADARMGEAQAKELELRAAVTTLEIQQEALKAAQKTMVGASSGDEWKLKTEYEAKVRSLHLQMKDYKAQIKALRAQLARQESREVLRAKRSLVEGLAHAPSARSGTPSTSAGGLGVGGPGAGGGWGTGWGPEMERPLTPTDGDSAEFPGMEDTFSRWQAQPEEQWATLEGPETQMERMQELQRELRDRLKGLEEERRQRRQEHEAAMVKVKQRERQLEAGADLVHERELAEKRHQDELERMRVKLELNKERLKSKQDALVAACAEVDSQLAHLRSIRDSEAKLVQHAQQLFHGLEPSLAGLDANVLISARLASDHNITLKHLTTIQEVYRIKLANLDSAIRTRKRAGQADPRSALPREASDKVDAAVALKVDALTNREQAFILEAAQPPPDEPDPEPEEQNVMLHVVQPQLFDHGRGGGRDDDEDKVEALPAIFLPSASRSKHANANVKRLGGGYVSLAANRALLRHSVSAPTGELKTKLDYFAMGGAVVQTTDTPPSHGPSSPGLPARGDAPPSPLKHAA